MKSKIRKILFLIIMEIIALLIFSISSYATEWQTRGTIKNKDGYECNLETCSKNNTSIPLVYDTLNQSNVYCIQHGGTLKNTSSPNYTDGSQNYRVGSEIIVENEAMLAYILCHGTAGVDKDWKTTTKNNDVDPAQIALWMYINNIKKDYVRELLYSGNQEISCKPPTNRQKEIANYLYEAAEKYKADQTKCIPQIILNKDGNNLEIKISGNFTNFTYEIYVNGVKKGDTKSNEKESKETTITISESLSEYSAEANDNIKVKVTATGIPRYCVKYRILSCANRQRLLAVTGVIEKGVEKSNSATYKVPSGEESETIDIPTPTGALTITKIVQAVNGVPTGRTTKEYAYNIEAGDYVTYQLVVKNNSDHNINNVKVTDSVPSNAVWKQYYYNEEYTDLSGESNAVIYLGTLEAGKSKTIYIQAQFTTYTTSKVCNTADVEGDYTYKIPEVDEKGNPRKDNEGNAIEIDITDKYSSSDTDCIKMKPYKVSLEKYIIGVNDEVIAEREGKPEYIVSRDSANSKYNTAVTLDSGDIVKYKIKVTNNGNTVVKNINISDKIPLGTQTISGTTNVTFGNELNPGESSYTEITLKVNIDQTSLAVFENNADINSLENKNGISVTDSTPNDNSDSDYFQLGDIKEIAGTVWNDKYLDKNANYNGLKDNIEPTLKNIVVSIWRASRNGTFLGTTQTDENGRYSFTFSNMKSYKDNNNNHWTTYNTYYIEFEYDGIIYTSTTLKNNEKLGSNAAEDYTQNTKRKAFNDKYSTINNSSNVNYITLNEEGFIPETNYVQINQEKDEEGEYTGIIDTDKIMTSGLAFSIGDYKEEKLQNLNLGLRGKDLFDLELSNYVSNIAVTVNNQTNNYTYGPQVTIRRTDIAGNYGEDMANKNTTQSEYIGSTQAQVLRKTDIATGDKLKELTGSSYENAGLGILVTYKITIKNASKTAGYASVITDYYDSRYTFVEAKQGETKLETSEGESREINIGSKTETDSKGNRIIEAIKQKINKSVIIKTNEQIINPNESTDIYVTYSLNSPTTTLKTLLDGVTKIPTYNLAEITEYKTRVGEGQTEGTRGLIDKDSMPGSANKEQVRLTTTQGKSTALEGGNPTTVAYYFSKISDNNVDLSKLKYEDDTATAPVLYFTTPEAEYGAVYTRTIEGTVFEDLTKINNNKVKSGNGIKDENEVGIYGVKVELIEKTQNGDIVRYTKTSDKTGYYKFENFLPGNYIIKYSYGDTNNTVLLNQSENGINAKSYNGEDFQSTNNAYIVEGLDTNTLDRTDNYWYILNENVGISVATDNFDRRTDVSNNASLFTDEEMKVLNNIRDGKEETENNIKNIIEKTNMYAETNQLIIDVEERIKTENNNTISSTEFKEYKIQNMNFGLAEVPVTTIDLQKHIYEFTITDSVNKNIIVSINSQGEVTGYIQRSTVGYLAQIEDDILQGARLQVTYKITASMEMEKNYDNTALTVPSITGIVDFIDNDLSYNATLGENEEYWELTTHDQIKQIFAQQKGKDGTIPQGTVDPEGTKYTTIVKAKSGNPILLEKEGTGETYITLEKILTSTDTTIEQIITSKADSFAYDNIIEITGLNYNNTKTGATQEEPLRDRIRTKDRYIIVPGVHHDSAAAETITITPPTGFFGVETEVILIMGLGVAIIAVGIILIKKHVLI